MRRLGRRRRRQRLRDCEKRLQWRTVIIIATFSAFRFVVVVAAAAAAAAIHGAVRFCLLCVCVVVVGVQFGDRLAKFVAKWINAHRSFACARTHNPYVCVYLWWPVCDGRQHKKGERRVQAHAGISKTVRDTRTTVAVSTLCRCAALHALQIYEALFRWCLGRSSVTLGCGVGGAGGVGGGDDGELTECVPRVCVAK